MLCPYLDVNHCMCCVCNFKIWFKYIYKAPKSIFHSGHNIIVRMFESNTEVMTQSLRMCGEVIRMNLVIGGQNYIPHWIQTQMKSKYELVLQRIRIDVYIWHDFPTWSLDIPGALRMDDLRSSLANGASHSCALTYRGVIVDYSHCILPNISR
jgi:hypothetical protein